MYTYMCIYIYIYIYIHTHICTQLRKTAGGPGTKNTVSVPEFAESMSCADLKDIIKQINN